ncbi:MAG: hypothetical protein R3D29_11855 [Nitratireductor sp.]
MNILGQQPCFKNRIALPCAPVAGAFVVILAALMSLNVPATDIMLPGFPDIAKSLDLQARPRCSARHHFFI